MIQDNGLGANPPEVESPPEALTAEDESAAMEPINRSSEFEAVRRQKARDDDEIAMLEGNVESARVRYLEALKQKLAEAGVDVEDPKSLGAFIDWLYREQPDVADMFVAALRGLMPRGNAEQAPSQSPGDKYGRLREALSPEEEIESEELPPPEENPMGVEGGPQMLD